MSSEGKIWGIITAISLAALLVLLYQEYIAESPNSAQSNSTDEPILPLASTADNPDPIASNCLDHTGLARHDHSNLTIIINGNEHEIPSDLGINTEICNQEGAYMHAVHTHDASGRLHIESNTAIDIPIGVFFDIWGVHFNETGIFDYRVNSTHELIFIVDGVTNYDYDDYLLVNNKEIVIMFQSRSN